MKQENTTAKANLSLFLLLERLANLVIKDAFYHGAESFFTYFP